MSDCIFCKIINKEITSELLYEDEHIVAFKDIRPKAPIHILVVTKEHIASLKEIEPKHEKLMFHAITKLNEIAMQHKLSGFRTIVNTGPESGQEVFHLHFHILGGSEKLAGF